MLGRLWIMSPTLRPRLRLLLLLLLLLLPLTFLSTFFSCLYNLATSESVRPPLITSFDVMRLFGPPGYRPFRTCTTMSARVSRSKCTLNWDVGLTHLSSTPKVYPAGIASAMLHLKLLPKPKQTLCKSRERAMVSPRTGIVSY